MALEIQATSLPSRRPWLIPMAVFLSLAVMGGVYLAFGHTPYAVLFSDLRGPDAASIITQLKKDGVPYRLAQSGATILVPESKRDEAQIAIAGSGLSLNGSEGFELFNNSDMGLTDFAQKIKYQRALQGELARTIMMMEGVKEARVHLAIPERSVFRGEQLKGKAAVSIIWKSPEFESTAQVLGVQSLVASSVPGLNQGDVTVLNGKGQVSSLGLSTPGSNALTPNVDASVIPTQIELREVVGRALGDQPFEVVLGSPANTLLGTPNETLTNTVSLSPEIQQSNTVIITTREELTSSVKEQIATNLFVASIIGEDQQELILYTINPQLAPNTHSRPLPADGWTDQNGSGRQPKWLGSSAGVYAQVGIWAGILLFVGAICIGLILAFRKVIRPKLTPQAHEEFAQILTQEFQLRFKGARQDAA